MHRYACVLFLVLILAGCASPHITIQMLEPASTEDVANFHRLALSNFRNDQGGVTKASVENALSSVVLGGKQYFSLVDIRTAQNYQDGSYYDMDASQLSTYGRNLGADGVITGTVTRSNYNHERSTEKRYICVDWNENGFCKKMAMRPVECVRRVAVFTFIPKVVNVSTGQIVISREFSETADSLACAGTDEDQLASPTDLIDSARAKAVERFVNMVAPHTVQVQIPLLVEDDSGMPESVKAAIANGVDFAKAGRMDKACSLWKGAANSHKAGYALPYLSGVCAEFAGDLAEAQSLYSLADQRMTKPIPEIADALDRIKQMKANREKLKSQVK